MIGFPIRSIAIVAFISLGSPLLPLPTPPKEKACSAGILLVWRVREDMSNIFWMTRRRSSDWDTAMLLLLLELLELSFSLTARMSNRCSWQWRCSRGGYGATIHKTCYGMYIHMSKSSFHSNMNAIMMFYVIISSSCQILVSSTFYLGFRSMEQNT